MTPHPVCTQCIYAGSQPTAQPCGSCYWNGGLTNAFTPPKDVPKRHTAKGAAAPSPKKRHRGRKRPQAARTTA